MAWLGGLWFNLVMALLAVGTVWEVWRILSRAGYVSELTICVILAAALWLSPWLSSWFLAGFAAGVLVVTSIALLRTDRPRSRKWLTSLFCGVYPTLGYFLAAELRETGAGQDGFWLILALFMMIWGNDVFAYFGGKNFGKRKLAPAVSPNKTWEGFAFGIVGAFAGALIAWSMVSDFPLTIAQLLPAALITSVTGPVGDLLESKLKRMAGMKDSSSLLPGHGGLFDRFDALILTAPFLYFYFTLFV